MTSPTKPGYKHTELGDLPAGWALRRIGEIITEMKNGFASGKRDESGIVQIRMNNVTTDGRVIFDSFLKVPKMELSEQYILKEGDFLFNNTNSQELVGKSAIFNGAPFPCTFSNHFTRLRFDLDRVLPEWILPHFVWLWQKGYFKSKAIRHVGQAAVNSRDVLQIRVPVPPLSEQKKIAEILSTVDDSIQKTDEIISATERFKKGLMQRLLTRGIGHTRFKQTELGEIPTEWEVEALGVLCGPRGEFMVPEVTARQRFVGMEHIDSGATDIARWEEGAELKSLKAQFETGDILYGKLRPYLDKAAIAGWRGICSTDLLVLTAVEGAAIAPYMVALLHTKRFLRFAVSTTRGTNHPRTNWDDLENFRVLKPPVLEQRKIADILGAVDDKIQVEKRQKEALERLKRGLMQVLLTGKVRVKV